ncbi:hypothetical protein [Streptomyces sp. AGS-58]|uniref:hypothetical protein n=1 Tax=unclassified Streptomyces TaxID=2593676 RepID=UPI0035A32A47
MSAYQHTARRLTHLAALVRTRAYHPQRYMVETLASAIDFTADIIRDHPLASPETPEVSPAAEAALREVTDLLAQYDFMIPACIIDYATAPLTGVMPTMQPLQAINERFAQRDADLRARRTAIVEHGHLNSRDDEVLEAALDGLMILHRKHARLAGAVAADNARPCNRSKAAARN